MRFLVDHNLPAATARLIATVGHDVVHTSQVGLAKASDPDVFAYCRVEDRILVTADKKLTKFLASEQATSPSTILLRNVSALDEANAAILAGLRTIELTIATRGASVFSLAPGKPIRVEILPLGHMRSTTRGAQNHSDIDAETGRILYEA
jgi:predicted nuclease of predicted toxin-antitoxin system